MLKDPARRDPRVYVIPANQADPATATKFINTLRYIGVEIQQATAPLTANGKTYPAGSYVVKTAQAGRAHVLDMFEPQDHPNDMDERGIPRRPYDNAGWTLSYQMGVKVDRIWDDVTGPLQGVEGLASPIPGRINGTAATGYLLSPSINDSFTIANRVMKANGEVYRLGAPMASNGKTYPAGTLYIAASATSTPIVQKGAQELGVNMDATAAGAGRRDEARAAADRLVGHADRLDAVGLDAVPARALRVPLHRRLRRGVRRHGAALEVRRHRHAVGRGLPRRRRRRWRWRRGGGGGGGGGAVTPNLPRPPALGRSRAIPICGSLCQVTTGTGTGATAEANVRKFVETGGAVIAAGSAARSIADLLDLPVSDYLVERQPGQPERA